MANSELTRRAELEIVAVVERWAAKKPWLERELSPLEEELRGAAYELERARRVTGQVRVAVAKKDE